MRTPRPFMVAAAVSCALAGGTGTAQAAVQNSQSGWAWGNPQPQGNTIRAMDFAPGRTYAVGEAGTALRSDDGGTTWTGLATGTSATLDRVQAVTQDVVVIQGGNGCVVRRSDDGGRTFRKLYILAEAGCPDPVQIAYFVDPQTGYLVLRDGTVLRTTDGGQTFGRTQTAVPATRQRGGSAMPIDAVFTGPDAGVVFLDGGTTGFRTTDAGTSWQEVDVNPSFGSVRRVEQVDPTTIYAVGPNVLLRSTDQGLTWRTRPGITSEDLTSIKCATPALCLMTVGRGDALLRTDDAGETTPQRINTTQGVFAAGFASPTRAVGAGAGGATVTSDDEGRTYAPVGGDIGGSYPFGLRLGPSPQIAFALGARGDLARTTDGGTTWRQLRVATTADLRDVSFTSADDGYVLDQRGGLFRTANGGQSWQTLDPGQGIATGLLALPDDVVLLAGPKIRRQEGNGRFEEVGGALRGSRTITALDRAGSAVFAYGQQRAARSTDGGVTWRAIRVPSVKVGRRTVPRPIADLDFATPTRGRILTGDDRAWSTRDGGLTWSELAGLGTNEVLSLVFSDVANGFATLDNFPADPAGAYVLRTTDGGATWRPQRVSTGTFAGAAGVVAPDGSRAFAITSTPSAGENVFRSLFATSTGGDAGTPSPISLTTNRRSFTKRRLKRAGNSITVNGTLPGAQGGEPIVVSLRQSGRRWTFRVVLAGANNGSFTARFQGVTRSSEVVAQWAGDSGRQGAGSRVLRIRVR